MADYSEEVNKFQLDLIDKLVLEVTPDKAIAKVNELVVQAMDMEKSGKEKFEWVVSQIKPALNWAISKLVETLVQVVYEMVVGLKDDLVLKTLAK